MDLSKVELEKKLTNCISRQNITIKNEFTFGELKLDLEQRLLTKIEVDTLKKMTKDLTTDEDAFSAILKANPIDGSSVDMNKLDSKTLYVLNNVNAELEKQIVENNCWAIAKSLTPNLFYGGYCKVNGKTIPTFEELIEVVKEMDIKLFDELYENLKELQNPTQKEIDDLK